MEDKVTILISINGPLVIKGNVDVVDIDGSVTSHEKRCVLCRCGVSNNKPYCDGSHKKIDFEG